MRALRRFIARVRNVALRHPRWPDDERLREEIEAHLALQAEENLRAGMTPTEARRRARMKFGAVPAVREEYHTAGSFPLAETVLRDVRYSVRMLRNSPAFTLAALVTLMLGIGANVVVLGVVNAVLLHPLGVSDPGSLYQLRHKAWMSGRLLTTSYPAFEDFRQRNTTFSGMAAINAYSHVGLSWRDAGFDAAGDEVSGSYFDLLGVQPALGRFFHAADEHGANSAPYLVLSDELWRSRFHGDAGVVGTTVSVNKHLFTVIGVAPEPFHGTERFVWPDYWIPIVDGPELDGWDSLHSRTSVAVTVIGRAKPGVTPQQATANLNAIAGELGKEHPESDDGQPLRLIHPGLYGDDGEVIRGFLWSVTALALLVLAAACANLATLSAARAADRSREFALRVALGSSASRLLRQLMTEAIVVALMGGAAGLGIAALLLRLLSRWTPAEQSHLAASVDGRVSVLGLALTVLSALLFGMAPARQAWQTSPLQSLKSGGMEVLHLRRVALRDLLLGVQIAICTLLVTASLVAVRGMVQTLHAPLGFKPQGAMLADVDLSSMGLTADGLAVKQRAIIAAAQSAPGVTGAGAVNRMPMTGGIHGIAIFRPGTTEFKINNAALASYVFEMTPGYLEAAGTRLLSGRDFAWQDAPNTPDVAVVNETFARELWGDTPAVGRHFIVNGNLTEVVGVAEDGKYHDMQETPQPAAYLPMTQVNDGEMILVVRSRETPSQVAAELERRLSGIAPNVSITMQSWPDALSSELFPAQAATVALGTMGLLAAMLAVTGIFGMAAYSVSRRMKELGIRMALGARKVHVVVAAVGRPLALLGVGSVAGLLAGVFASRFLGQIVYRANPRDPLVVGGAVLTMAMLGALAAAIPARRALSADPSKLMREE